MRPASLDVDVREATGHTALDQLGTRYDRLADLLDVPLTSRRPWLSSWVVAYPSHRPWAISAWAGRELVGACVLAERTIGRGLEIVSVGHGRNDRSRLLARDGHVAAALATTIARRFGRLQSPWSLRIEQLPVGDPVAGALVELLPEAALIPGGNVPGVDFAAGGSVGAHLTKNLRRQLKKSTNRATVDGLDLTMAFSRVRDDLMVHLDEIELIHRTRDHDVGRASDIDDSAGRRLWRTIIASHIERDEVEIATLRLDGALAAYVISFLDDSTYRVFDGRFVTGWARYSPGRLLEVETLARALADRRFTKLDWMNSIAPDKLIAANTLEPTMHLVGSRVA